METRPWRSSSSSSSPSSKRLKISSALLVMLGALLFTVSSAQASELSIGDSAPSSDIAMTNLDGTSVSIDDVRGENGTLVIFTCNHCPYVVAWESRTVEIGNALADQGIGVIAINSNDPANYPDDSLEGMQQRAEELGVAYPYVVDDGSAVAKAFGAAKTPEFFLFNADGALVYQGALDDNSEDASSVTQTYLSDAIDAMLANNSIATQETKAIGCGIKWYE